MYIYTYTSYICTWNIIQICVYILIIVMYGYIATTRGLIIVSHWELDCRRRYYNAALTSVRLTSTATPVYNMVYHIDVQ